ncbi:unnamed protein product [Arabis nemorensis]|uniref:Uncharacterized protein n=1 Tax=Arabis nemorensis TaxID=586526 RepID=A0A565CQA6_9BRAS|nr:unnamed protein product [Arabis nemorensis]
MTNSHSVVPVALQDIGWRKANTGESDPRKHIGSSLVEFRSSRPAITGEASRLFESPFLRMRLSPAIRSALATLAPVTCLLVTN